MKRALVSVSDKSGLVDFVRGLKELGYEIISYCAVRFALLDGLFAAMAASPEVGNDFLTSATFEQKAVPIGEFSL